MSKNSSYNNVKDHAYKVATSRNFEFNLTNTFTDRHGRKRVVGFVEFSVQWSLDWLEHNLANRPVNWGHAWTLCQSMRNTEPGQGWVGEANIYVMTWEDKVGDGQHRPIAKVLAHGNRAQVERLLQLCGVACNANDPTGKVCFDPLVELPVPIREWKLWDKDEPTPQYIPVLFNANPEVGDKADTDQRKRTGADQLARHSDSANLMTELGVSPAEMQKILRYMYLSVLPPTSKAQEAGAKYGSIRKGGNIHPDRYPVMAANFKEYIEKAFTLLHATKGVHYSDIPIDHHQLVGAIALAIQGGVAEARIVAFLKTWSGEDQGQDKQGNDRPRKYTGTAKVVREDRQSKTGLIDEYHRSSIVKRYLQASDPNPACSSATQLIKALGEGHEQQSANRLPGWDSEGCPHIISKSLKNKINSDKAQKAKKAAKAAK